MAVLGAGAGAVAAVDVGLLPGRAKMFTLLGWNGSPGVVPRSTPGPLISGRFASRARLGASVGWSIAYPPGSNPGDRLPVVVVLHGFGGDHEYAFGRHLGLDHFLAQDHAAHGTRFAIASIDGGNTYWHRRRSGEDAGAMVSDEFVPLLATHGLDTSRIGLLGWSMGAYGALLLGTHLGRLRVAAIAAESPALWHTASQAAGIAFDGATDFEENTVFGRQAALDGISVRIDCGTGDAFAPAARDYVAGFSTDHHPAGSFEPGGHDLAYWRRIAPAQLRFLGARLA